jgi:hypothetical protein
MFLYYITEKSETSTKKFGIFDDKIKVKVWNTMRIDRIRYLCLTSVIWIFITLQNYDKLADFTEKFATQLNLSLCLLFSFLTIMVFKNSNIPSIQKVEGKVITVIVSSIFYLILLTIPIWGNVIWYIQVIFEVSFLNIIITISIYLLSLYLYFYNDNYKVMVNP